MAAITTKDGTQLYYNDWGMGQPVVFSHGWPLSADPQGLQGQPARHVHHREGSAKCRASGFFQAV